MTIGPILPPDPRSITAPGAKTTSGDFASVFRNAVASVEAQQTAADAVANQFLNGENVEVHQVALAAQKAELSFEMFLQSRNKIVQAYQEIMRMQF